MRSVRATRIGALLLMAAASLLTPACEEGTPVSPEDAILRISAQPTRIGTDGSATITIIVLRSTGNPVNPGTEVRLSTSLGTIEPVVLTDDDGVAHGSLRGDGRSGTATVRAFSGAVDPVTIDVILVDPDAGSIRLQATPTSITEAGGEIELVALVRDGDSEPFADAEVNFFSSVGTLESQGRTVVTDEDGLASDTLTLTAAQLVAFPEDSLEVSAETGGSDGVQTDTAEITIRRSPRASFSFSISGTIVTFTDSSTRSPTTWTWDFGDSSSSTLQNPIHTYATSGVSFTVTLIAANDVGESSASSVVTIPAVVP